MLCLHQLTWQSLTQCHLPLDTQAMAQVDYAVDEQALQGIKTRLHERAISESNTSRQSDRYGSEDYNSNTSTPAGTPSGTPTKVVLRPSRDPHLSPLTPPRDIGTQSTPVARTRHSPVASFRETAYNNPEQEDTFGQIDTNNDGVIDRSEWNAHMSSRTTKPVDHDAIDNMIEILQAQVQRNTTSTVQEEEKVQQAAARRAREDADEEKRQQAEAWRVIEEAEEEKVQQAAARRARAEAEEEKRQQAAARRARAEVEEEKRQQAAAWQVMQEAEEEKRQQAEAQRVREEARRVVEEAHRAESAHREQVDTPPTWSASFLIAVCVVTNTRQLMPLLCALIAAF